MIARSSKIIMLRLLLLWCSKMKTIFSVMFPRKSSYLFGVSLFKKKRPCRFSEFRKMVIDLVMSTDLALHFDFLAQFKAMVRLFDTFFIISVNTFCFKYSLPRTPLRVFYWARLCVMAFTFAPLVEKLGPDAKDRLMIFKMALKCADVSHSAKFPTLHLKWTQRIIEEFYRQGDEERKSGVPISPFMVIEALFFESLFHVFGQDRMKANVPRAQIGFFDFVVVPLYEAINGYYKQVFILNLKCCITKSFILLRWAYQLRVLVNCLPTETIGLPKKSLGILRLPFRKYSVLS